MCRTPNLEAWTTVGAILPTRDACVVPRRVAGDHMNIHIRRSARPPTSNVRARGLPTSAMRRSRLSKAIQNGSHHPLNRNGIVCARVQIEVYREDDDYHHDFAHAQ